MVTFNKAYHGLTKRKIALGCRGVPAGFTPTYSQKEFFDQALHYAIINLEEYSELETKYKLTWCRSLKELL